MVDRLDEYAEELVLEGGPGLTTYVLTPRDAAPGMAMAVIDENGRARSLSTIHAHGHRAYDDRIEFYIDFDTEAGRRQVTALTVFRDHFTVTGPDDTEV